MLHQSISTAPDMERNAEFHFHTLLLFTSMARCSCTAVLASSKARRGTHGFRTADLLLLAIQNSIPHSLQYTFSCFSK